MAGVKERIPETLTKRLIPWMNPSRSKRKEGTVHTAWKWTSCGTDGNGEPHMSNWCDPNALMEAWVTVTNALGRIRKH